MGLSTLSPEQVALLRESYRRLARAPEDASERFYARLFEIAPELRPMFPSDMSEQGMKFMSTLGIILDRIEDPELLEPYIEALARGHAACGVKREHFPLMRRALVETMREALGAEFPEGADAAWEVAYDRLARKMIRVAG